MLVLFNCTKDTSRVKSNENTTNKECFYKAHAVSLPTALLLCSQFHCSHKELHRSQKNHLKDREEKTTNQSKKPNHNRSEIASIEYSCVEDLYKEEEGYSPKMKEDVKKSEIVSREGKRGRD